jgi:hypothetical protein
MVVGSKMSGTALARLQAIVSSIVTTDLALIRLSNYRKKIRHLETGVKWRHRKMRGTADA